MGPKEAVALGGVLAAAAVLMGAFAPWVGGIASDRFGRASTGFSFSFLSALFSFSIGWLIGSPMEILTITGLIYGFLISADSAIYKVKLSELIPGKHLSLALASQSALGYSPQ